MRNAGPLPRDIQSLFRVESGVDPGDKTILLSHAIHTSRETIFTHPDRPVSKKSAQRFLSFLKRRKEGEPVAYILREKEFFGRAFTVTPSTLIPRPETETLVEILLAELRKSAHQNQLVLDIGTGSGNIIVTLAAETTNQKDKDTNSKQTFIAIERSARALTIAKRNALKHHVERNIQFIQSNLLTSLPDTLIKPAHAIYIAANLPYLSERRYASCSRDVREYEPKAALLAGKDGLDDYRSLLKQIQKRKEWNQKPLFAIFEIDPEQESEIRTMASKQLPDASVRFIQDLSGITRFALIERDKDTHS